MPSLDYIIAHTRIVRRILRWTNQRKINRYLEHEKSRYANNPTDLRNFENKIFSQNGEDGIIEEIFSRIGSTNKYFVEFGIEDGRECNTRHLMERKGWQGLLMDGSESNCAYANQLAKLSGTKVICSFVTADNIESLLNEARAPKDMDMLSIDIDGNDFWIWKAIKNFQPRVLVIEYNASYPPPEKWVMPYNKNHIYDGTNYFGASLVALNELCDKKGYTLVACDKAGVNAFFVRNDLVGDKFLKQDVHYFYSCPKYGALFFGHPKGKGPWIVR
jgi:hypothetical protein